MQWNICQLLHECIPLLKHLRPRPNMMTENHRSQRFGRRIIFTFGHSHILPNMHNRPHSAAKPKPNFGLTLSQEHCYVKVDTLKAVLNSSGNHMAPRRRLMGPLEAWVYVADVEALPCTLWKPNETKLCICGTLVAATCNIYSGQWLSEHVFALDNVSGTWCELCMHLRWWWLVMLSLHS